MLAILPRQGRDRQTAYRPIRIPPLRSGAAFLNWLCAQLELPWIGNTAAITDVWRRIPHPDKPIAPGPELDAVLVAERIVVMVEAKWGSVEGTGQGVAGDKGQ